MSDFLCPNCKVPLFEIDKGRKTQRLGCPLCIYNIPLNPGNTKMIDEFYCWLSVDHNGHEGMVGIKLNGVFTVAQHSMKEMAQRFRPDMIESAKQLGMKMRLVKFVKAEIMEEI